MARRGFLQLLTILVLIGGALALRVLAPPAAAAAPPCARAQALLGAGYYSDAEKAFKAEFGRAHCSVVGAAAVRAKEAAVAKREAALARTTAASRFNRAVRLIRRLEAEGFESEARKQTQTLISSFPERAIPDDIRAANQPVGWWRRLEGNVGPALRVALEALIAALGGLLILVVAFRTVVGAVKRVAVPTFTLSDVSGASPNDVLGQPGLLAAELARIGGDDGGETIRRVSPSEGNFDLPAALTNAYPQVGVIAAVLSLLDRFLPRRLWEVSAIALPLDPVRGAGLTVTIAARGGRQLRDITLWEAEFGNVEADTPMTQRLERLMLPAAVWLAYQPEIGRNRKAAASLGTAEWRSYAYFTIGERFQQHGDTVNARRAYFRALDQDPANLGARLNLAGLLLYRPAEEAATETSAGAGSRLRFAEWLLTDPAIVGSMTCRLGTKYRWLYLRAGLALAMDEPAKARWAAGALWLEIRPSQAWQSGSKPVRLVKQMRWPAFVLLQSARLDGGPPGPDLSAVMMEWWSPNVLYNLACYEARKARLLPGGQRAGTRSAEEQGELLARARRYLRDAIDRAGEPKLMLAMARTDPVLDDVVKGMALQDLATLTGQPIGQPPYAEDARIGHGLGVRIREAIRTTIDYDAPTQT